MAGLPGLQVGNAFAVDRLALVKRNGRNQGRGSLSVGTEPPPPRSAVRCRSGCRDVREQEVSGLSESIDLAPGE